MRARLFAVIMAFVLIVGLLPVSALAKGDMSADVSAGIENAVERSVGGDVENPATPTDVAPDKGQTKKTAAALNGGNPALPGHGSSNNEPPSGPPYTLDANNGTFNDQTVLMTGLDGKLTSLPTHPDANMRFTGRFTLGGREITLDSVFAADAAVFAELRKKTNSTRTLTLTSDPAGAGTLEGGGELE